MKRTKSSKSVTRRNAGKKLKQKLPPGWNERRIRAVIQHYEGLSDEELAHEIETAPEVTGETLVSIPTELLPAVRKLIVQHCRSA